MTDKIEKILRDLAVHRTVFHSEADFQHAFAWEIQKRLPKAQLRLEIHPDRVGKREYIDIWVKDHGKIYAIELKYKTKKIVAHDKGEDFHLLDQSAQDLGRYDFIKDIDRCTRFVKGNPKKIGYAIILTNDPTYWRKSKRKGKTVDEAFRLHEGRTLKKGEKMLWQKHAAKGTMKNRERPHLLKSSYLLNWKDYSRVSDDGPGLFRYLCLKIHT